jgi:hypothetical protein
MAIFVDDSMKENKYRFHLINGKVFAVDLYEEEILKIRKQWLISTVDKYGEIVIRNYIIQAKDLIAIAKDISEDK